MSAWTSASRVTSQRTAIAWPPAARMLSAPSRMPASSMSASTTLRPCSANACAVARPIPAAAPVTRATCPENVMLMIVLPDEFDSPCARKMTAQDFPVELIPLCARAFNCRLGHITELDARSFQPADVACGAALAGLNQTFRKHEAYSMTLLNQQFLLAQRPIGAPTRETFDYVEKPVSEPGPNQLLVKVEYLSLDPARHDWLKAAKSYLPPAGLGETIPALGACKVNPSPHPP